MLSIQIQKCYVSVKTENVSLLRSAILRIMSLSILCEKGIPRYYCIIPSSSHAKRLYDENFKVFYFPQLVFYNFKC